METRGARVGVLSVVVTALALASFGCGSDETAAPAATGPRSTDSETTTAATTVTSVPPQNGLPKAVADVRADIVTAAERGDYELLRPLVEPAVFLSDFGFGARVPDPVGRWEDVGPEPLEAMGALLRLPHAVRETNEGTLYEWPRFDADSRADDLSAAEREVFLTFMTEDELVNAFLADYGYAGPRLGILADGTWWFFLREGRP